MVSVCDVRSTSELSRVDNRCECYERQPMTFHFRLESVLKLRQHERERERQIVAQARRRHGEVTSKKEAIAQARFEVISELRQMKLDDIWVVDQIQSRQCHIEILNQELRRAEADIASAELLLAECLKRLISADQAACSLERLAELQRTEFHRIEAKNEARSIDDLAKPDRRVA